MALINCPECGKEISDKAESCPNCGYVLVKKIDEPPKNLLKEKQSHPILGIPLVLLGIVCFLFGLFTLPTIFGFAGLISFGVLFSGGYGLIVGSRKGACPYCGQEVSVLSNARAYKCPRCRKRIICKDDHLETID